MKSFYLILQSFALGLIVDINHLDCSEHCFVLNTLEQGVKNDFIRASQTTFMQTAFTVCLNALECNMTSDFKGIYYRNGEYNEYTWDFDYNSFKDFFFKVTNPVLQVISTNEQLAAFKKHQTGFLFFASEGASFDMLEKYHQDPIYFGVVYENTLKQHLNIGNGTLLRLYGIDEVYKYQTFDNFVEFIDNHKCGLLLPYSDSLWVKKCLSGKVVVASFIIKQRKGHWNMYAGPLKQYGHEILSNNSAFQMVYIDVKAYPKLLANYRIPVTPCVLVLDNRCNQTYYLGEIDLKNKKKFFEILSKVFSRQLALTDYTVEKTFTKKKITLWQLFPLAFLLLGLLLVIWMCFKNTFKAKEKVN
jgi:hypothetical protein